MTFTNDDKLTVMAIVRIFETSRAVGDYAAYAVLDDGAGVSYGISQFTHRSGSLCSVVEAYLADGGAVGRGILEEHLPLLRLRDRRSIRRAAESRRLRNALRAAAVTSEMKRAQDDTAARLYLGPAIAECERLGFILPLSLGVVYDSITHGGWDRIAALVKSPTSDEKRWVLEYLRRRHAWLTSVPRLKATNYRTRFFMSQAALGNWDLRRPVTVHGVRLEPRPADVAAVPVTQPPATDTSAPSDDEVKPGVLERTSDAVAAAAVKFDRVDGIVTAFSSRTDAAKSLWATVLGTAWQSAWAVFGFVAGLPREVWIVTAVIAAVLTGLYIYRQIALGRLREEVAISSKR